MIRRRPPKVLLRFQGLTKSRERQGAASRYVYGTFPAGRWWRSPSERSGPSVHGTPHAEHAPAGGIVVSVGGIDADAHGVAVERIAGLASGDANRGKSRPAHASEAARIEREHADADDGPIRFDQRPPAPKRNGAFGEHVSNELTESGVMLGGQLQRSTQCALLEWPLCLIGDIIENDPAKSLGREW